MNDGLIGLIAAIALTLAIVLLAAIATSPRELVIIFGDLRVEYRQY